MREMIDSNNDHIQHLTNLKKNLKNQSKGALNQGNDQGKNRNQGQGYDQDQSQGQGRSQGQGQNGQRMSRRDQNAGRDSSSLDDIQQRSQNNDQGQNPKPVNRQREQSRQIDDDTDVFGSRIRKGIQNESWRNESSSGGFGQNRR